MSLIFVALLCSSSSLETSLMFEFYFCLNFRYYEDNWSPSHQCHKTQSHAYEIENRSKTSSSYSDNRKRRKAYVFHAVMTGPQAIKVGTIRQYSAESSMEGKCKSLHKKSHLIPIPTPNHNAGRN